MAIGFGFAAGPGGAHLVARGVAYLDLDDTAFTRGLDRAESTFKTRLTSIGRNMTALGSTMTQGLTLPIVGAGAAATVMALDFEESLTRIRALVGASRKQVEEWGEEILDLSGVVGKPPKELAEALYFVASSGVPASKAMDVVTASAKAAASGLGETQVVADAVSSVLNAYGTENITAAAAVDVLTASVREGKGEADAFAPVIGNIIPIAAELGVEFHEVGASLAAMTRFGTSAKLSAVSVRAILQTLIKPTAQTEEQLSKMGYSMDELRKSVRERGLFATLMDLRKEIGNNKEAIGKLFPNQRALVGFLQLTGKAAEKNRKIFKELADSFGDTAEAFAKTQEDASFRISKAWGAIQAALIRIGGILTPYIGRLAIWIAKWAEKFSKLSEETKKIILVIAAVVAVAGPLLVILGSLVLAVTALISPVGLAIAVIAGLVAAFAGLASQGKDTEKFLTDAWEKILSVGKEVWGWLVNFFNQYLLPIFNEVKDVAVEVFTAFARTLQEHEPEIRRIMGRIGQVLEILATWIRGLARIYGPLLEAFFNEIFLPLFGLAIKIVDKLIGWFARLVRVVGNVIETILGLLDKFMGGLQLLAEAASHLPGVGDKFRGIADKIGEAREGVRELRKDLQDLDKEKVIVQTIVTGNKVVYTVSGPGGEQKIVIDLEQMYKYPHRAGGMIRVGSANKDDVPALLSRGEFVVTKGGQAITESVLGKGYFNWLERAQPAHFAAGGFASVPGFLRPEIGRQIDLAMDTQRDAAFARIARQFAKRFPMAANPGGLVPRILDELGLALQMGLRLTSGFRPGAITSTGNVSLHSLGRAIDVAGTGGEMSSYFRAVQGRSGIQELLYSPIGGWYGSGSVRPLTGSVLRDHFDHVHVGVYQAGGRVRPWREREFGLKGPRRRKSSESAKAYQRYLRGWRRRRAELSVGSLPIGMELEQARAKASPTLVDDRRVANRIFRWFSRGRHTGWLTRRQRIDVINAWMSARDERQRLAEEFGDVEGMTPGQILAQAQALAETRSGFLGQFASNIFTPTAAGLTFGATRNDPGAVTGRTTRSGGSVMVNQYFNKPPEDPHPLLRSAEFAAGTVFG